MLDLLFAELGTTNKFFIEFGCGDATECNGAYLLERGWTGLQMDGLMKSANPRAVVHNEFITAENVNDVFRKHGAPEAFDLLSIDIDGNDFWVSRDHQPAVRGVDRIQRDHSADRALDGPVCTGLRMGW